MQNTIELADVGERPGATRYRPIGLTAYAPARKAARRASALALVAIAGLLCIPPVYFVIAAALSVGPNGRSGLAAMAEDPALGDTIRVTVILALGSVVISTTIGTALAWGAQGLTGRRRWLGYIPLVPLVMPYQATVAGFQYLLNPRIGYGNMLLRGLMFWSDARTGPFDVNTVPFILIVTATSLTSFVYLFVRSALSQLDQGIHDAAAACGASPRRAFFRIVLPMLRPSLVYAALTVMLLALGQFAAPLFFGRQDDINVLATSMYREISATPPDIPLAAAYGLPIIVAGLAFIALQRVALKDQGRYVSTDTKGAARSLSRSGILTQGSLVLWGLFAIVGPMLAVAVVAFQPFWSKNVRISDFTFDNFRKVFADPILTGAITNSVGYALLTTVIVVPLGYLCAKLLYRRNDLKVLAGIADVLVSISLGIPAVIFGIGFLLAYTRGPLNLYGSGAGLVVVYTVLSLPFVTRVVLVGMIGLGSNLVDAGAACGGPLWRTTAMLELPMLRPALANALAISLILTSHEFGASVLVRSTQTQVMGTVLYDQFQAGDNSQMAVMAFVMCVVTGIGVLLALVLNRPARTKDEPSPTRAVSPAEP